MKVILQSILTLYVSCMIVTAISAWHNTKGHSDRIEQTITLSILWPYQAAWDVGRFGVQEEIKP